MRSFYCDGSQHKELNRLGVGIVGEEVEEYVEVKNFQWNLQIHEIVALEKTIELALKNSNDPILIINDDKGLVHSINQCIQKRKRNKNARLSIKYSHIVSLMEAHPIMIKPPESPEERKLIKRAHDLSRTYLSQFAL